MATFNVTNLNDSGSGSLRQAILDANASAGEDLITFDSLLSGQTIALFSDELVITDSLTIDGDLDNNGTADITIQRDASAAEFRIFNVDDGDTSNQTVTLDGLTVTGGVASSEEGGGGILNQENLTVINSIVSGNATSGTGGGVSSGFDSYLTVSNSTIGNNFASGSGGGIYIYDSDFGGYLTVSNSTIGNNLSGGSGGGIAANTNSLVEVSNSTISNNAAAGNGGGISGLSVSVRNSTVSDNSSDYLGGGIYSRSVSVGNSTISDNVGRGIVTGGYDNGINVVDSLITGNIGGGIGAYDRSIVTVSNSTISDNSASSGAGIRLSDSYYLTVSDSTISGNSSTGKGGGIYVEIYAGDFRTPTTITNSTISNNSTTGDDGDGGGIYSYGARLIISNSTLNNNSTSGTNSDGGGIFATPFSRYTDTPLGSLVVSNSTISGNMTTGAGGGIATTEYNTLAVSNSTITDNAAADGQGSGISSYGGLSSDSRVVSSIVAGNVNSDIDVKDGSVASFVSGGNNLIGTGNATAAFIQPTDITEVTDPRLEPLANNGGPTQTHALKADSLAIDAGSNPDALTFDQRGSGFDRVVNGQADIGAFEVQTAVSNAFFFSADGDTTVGNLTVADEDIVFFDGADFSLFFDGSDVLPRSAEISAFDVINDTEILLSFDEAFTVDGIGLVDDSDVVKFTADSFGTGNTAGSFELYLDGSNLGLTRGSEDIDALTRMADGSLVFSTTGNAQLANGLETSDEDLISFNALTGELSLYFDGSDVGLTAGGEDLDAVGIREEQLLFSTTGNFALEGLSGRDEDAFSFTPSSLGGETSGSFGNELLFDGSEFGFTGDLSGIDFVG